jgi:arylsulfatase A
VLILADDMGYGDIRAYNPASKIPTPHLDRVAAEGMRFTDMHAGASWCMPSRYALMTGRYAWRDGHAKGLPKKPSGHRIDKGAPTLATVLKERGYRTACIGKWHLGMGERGAKHEVRKGVRIPMGPNDAGFDESYILHGSLDFGPYVFFENQMPIATPTERIPERNWPNTRRAMGEYWHASKGMPGWDFRQVLPHLRDQAVGFVERQSARQPFFLYFPLTAPHTPWMPTKEFPGRSGAGMYGDFVMQVDSVVGDVVRAIDQAGFGKNTLILFSSDNGAYWVAAEEKQFGHEANGPLRGGKNDAWEGGHRMPFLARWPGRIPKGGTTAALLCFTDLLATFATLAGQPLPAGHSAVDSHEASAAFFGKAGDRYAIRSTLSLVSGQKLWFRERDWKAISFLGSGGNTEPKKHRSKPGEPRGQLYHLGKDIGEEENRYQSHPEILKKLQQRRRDLFPNSPLGGI